MMALLNGFYIGLSAQTVFSHAVDTVTLSGKDRKTVVENRGHVFSVGDTVHANLWYVSNDSSNWSVLYDYNDEIVWMDSILIDTLPVWNYYVAALKSGYSIQNVSFKINRILYKTLQKPVVDNLSGIGSEDMLLLKHDSVTLRAMFNGLQADSVMWMRDRNVIGRVGTSGTIGSLLKVRMKGTYEATGRIYDRDGMVIDEASSSSVVVNFDYPLEAVIFKSWAGSNDGKPRRIDTLVIDTCIKQYVIDTLVYKPLDSYKYQFVPVIRAFSKRYEFSYKWMYENFAVVMMDSILEFNPVGSQHSGSYSFPVTWKPNATSTITYNTAQFRIISFDVVNESVKVGYIEDGIVYNMMGAVVRSGVKGYYPDVVRRLGLPAGVYILRDKVQNQFNSKFKI